MKTKEDKIIDAIGGLSDKNVMLTYDGNLSETDESEIAVHDERVKKISFHRIGMIAAACAAIAAVPVLMMYVNGKSGNGNDQLPVSSDTVTETTEISTEEVSDEHTENNDTDENKSNGQLSFGTGPERPENYTPDREYSYCTLEYETFVQEKEEDTSVDRNEFIYDYLKTILVDESFADEIVSDYKSQTEKYIESLGLKEGDYLLDYTIMHPGYGACMNGYMEIYANISYIDGSNREILDFVYDLAEEKKIDNISDLFYYGEDYCDEIITNHYYADFDTNSVKPEDITLTSVLIRYDGMIQSCMYNDRIYDISVTGRYRDLSGVIKDEFIDKDECYELFHYYTNTKIDNYNAKISMVGTRFDSESEINSNLRKERYSKVIAYLKTNHYLDDCADSRLQIDFIYDDSVAYVFGRIGKDGYMGNIIVKYDTEREEVISAVADIPE